jgi:hypothetical protein
VIDTSDYIPKPGDYDRGVYKLYTKFLSLALFYSSLKKVIAEASVREKWGYRFEFVSVPDRTKKIKTARIKI